MKEIFEILKKYSPYSVLEFGFGNGNLTKILRKSYPSSFFVGIDKNPIFLKETTLALFDKHFCEDILSVNINQKFDLIVFGNYRTPFWWIYNCYSKEYYIEIINRLISFLEKNGRLIFIAKTYRRCNLPSELLFKEYQNFLLIEANPKKYPENFLDFANSDIIDLTKELLHKLKINDIDIYTFEDKDECIYPENPCKNIQMKTSDANIQKSNKLNMQIKKVGLKYGYYDILVARLN